MLSGKAFVCVFGLVAIAAASDKHEYAKNLLTKSLRCKTEHNVTDEEAILFNSKTAEIVENRMKCMIKCVMIALDIMSPEGEINEELYYQNVQNVYDLDRAKAEEYSKPCLEEGKNTKNTADSPCEKSAVMHKCDLQMGVKYGLSHIMLH